MKFVASEPEIAVLGGAADVLQLDEPKMGVFVDIEDERLVNIARSLGMEQVQPVHYTGQSITTVSNEFARKMLLGVDSVEVRNEQVWVDLDAVAEDTAPKKVSLRNCEVCGKPVYKKRSHTCSEECRREKNRLYVAEYNKRKAAELSGISPASEIEPDFVEDADGGDDTPLAHIDQAAPEFVPVRVTGF